MTWPELAAKHFGHKAVLRDVQTLEDQAETSEGRRLRLRACESWGLDVVA